jgi:plasmid replication initiation protein
MTNDQHKKIELQKNRNSLVVKDNRIIRNVRYSLSAQEQKLIIYAVSKVVAEDKELKKISFKLNDYFNIVGSTNSGKDYQRVKATIRELRNKSWWIKDGDKEILFAWLDTARVNPKTREIELTLSESLKPYLIDLKQNFTKYELINVLCLRSKYSIRLYEIYKSYLWLGRWEVYLDEFRELIDVKDKYLDFTEFKRNVINPSIKEINRFTDLTITMETLKSGRNIDKLIFKIVEKKGTQLVLDLFDEQDNRLDG